MSSFFNFSPMCFGPFFVAILFVLAIFLIEIFFTIKLVRNLVSLLNLDLERVASLDD